MGVVIDVYATATHRLVLHLCVHSARRSDTIIHGVCEALEDAGDEDMLPLYQIASSMCVIDDGMQEERVLKVMCACENVPVRPTHKHPNIAHQHLCTRAHRLTHGYLPPMCTNTNTNHTTH